MRKGNPANRPGLPFPTVPIQHTLAFPVQFRSFATFPGVPSHVFPKTRDEIEEGDPKTAPHGAALNSVDAAGFIWQHAHIAP
jgi:hypothetical protein